MMCWEKKDFQEIKRQCECITNNNEYEVYGMRVQEDDTDSIGNTMTHLSTNNVEGFDEEKMDGVSSIGIEEVDDMMGMGGGYPGDYVYLIGSNESRGYGNDYGEIIIRNPIVLAKFIIQNGTINLTESI